MNFFDYSKVSYKRFEGHPRLRKKYFESYATFMKILKMVRGIGLEKSRKFGHFCTLKASTNIFLERFNMLKASRSTNKSQVVRKIKREGHATRRSEARKSNVTIWTFFNVANLGFKSGFKKSFLHFDNFDFKVGYKTF